MASKISILLPVYNGSSTLQRCLDSILKQTFRDFEVVVVDDGSTDNTPRLLKKYQTEDRRVLIFRQDHQGVSTARNAALNKSTGSYVGFVDADDYIEPDMFGKLYKAASGIKSDLAVCGYWAVSQQGELLNDASFSRSPAISDSLEEMFLEMIAPAPVLWNKLFSRKAIMEARASFQLFSGEDFWFCCRLLPYLKKAVILPDRLYYYVQNEKSLMNTPVRTDGQSLFTALAGQQAPAIRQTLRNQIWYCAFAGSIHSPESCLQPLGYFQNILRSIQEPERIPFCRAVQNGPEIKALVEKEIVGQRFYQVSRLIFQFAERRFLILSALLMKGLALYAFRHRLFRITVQNK